MHCVVIHYQAWWISQTSSCSVCLTTGTVWWLVPAPIYVRFLLFPMSNHRHCVAICTRSLYVRYWLLSMSNNEHWVVTCTRSHIYVRFWFFSVSDHRLCVVMYQVPFMSDPCYSPCETTGTVLWFLPDAYMSDLDYCPCQTTGTVWWLIPGSDNMSDPDYSPCQTTGTVWWFVPCAYNNVRSWLFSMSDHMRWVVTCTRFI